MSLPPTGTEPLFMLDLRDRQSGRHIAVALDRTAARTPLEDLVMQVLHIAPSELTGTQRIASAQESSLFRLADLALAVDDDGALLDEFYEGLEWRHQTEGYAFDPTRPPPFERIRSSDGPDVLVLAVEMDRGRCGYDRNWPGFLARRGASIAAGIDELCRRALEAAETTAGPGDPEWLEALTRYLAAAPFENYSRFLPAAAGSGAGVRLKTGDETVENVIAGRGGVCTEKVLALLQVLHYHGIGGEVVFAGPRARAPLPVDHLRRLLRDFDFRYARRYMRYWDHVALAVRLDGVEMLADPSGGNIPVRCELAAPWLDTEPQRTVTISTLVGAEPVTYHRAPQDLALDFLFAWETWIDDVDLMQVFDNQLGLLITDHWFVTPITWASATKREVAWQRWGRYINENGLRPPVALAGGPDGEHARNGDDAVIPHAEEMRRSLDGLAARYRRHILLRHGVDKPFGADLLAIRRPKQHSGDSPAVAVTNG